LGALLNMPSTIEPAAAAKPDEPADLAQGVDEVKERRYPEAVATLERVVRRLSAGKAARGDLVKANAYLGVAQLGAGDREAAVAYFAAALDLDRNLRLDPSVAPPEAIQALKEVKRERERQPAAARSPAPPRKKGGFPKVALIGGGAAAVAAGVLIAGGGGQPAQAGLVINSVSFGPSSAVCAETGALVNIPVALSADVTAGREGVGISGATVTLLGVDSGGQVTNPTVFAATRLEAGERRVLRLETRFTCQNPSGDAPRTERWRGRVRIGTIGFPTAETQNVLEIAFP
jgi:hypothetical protein